MRVPSLRRLLATTRAGNWWLSKLPPLCAVGYAMIALLDLRPVAGISALGGVLVALCVVAWFAHVVNDLTDRDDDRLSGKPNRLDGVPAWQAVTLATGLASVSLAIPFVLLAGDVATVGWIAANLVVFALYSIRPVRLKARGWWAVFADAAGAHGVPTLAVIAAIRSQSQEPVDLALAGSAVLWSMSAGVRNILAHQVVDADADSSAGIATVGNTMPVASIRSLVVRVILPLEAVGILVFSAVVAPAAPLLIPMLVVFVLVEWLRMRGGWRTRLLATGRGSAYLPLANNDFHELWLPLTLVVSLALGNPAWTVAVAGQVLLFWPGLSPRAKEVRRTARDVLTRGVPGFHRARSLRRRLLESRRSAPRTPRMPVVIGATGWDGDGINAAMARALFAGGWPVQVLWTEGSRVPSVASPQHVPVTRLDVSTGDSWGARWGETLRLLESMAPCVYFPGTDWRHAAIVPLLSDRVIVITTVLSDANADIAHAARLGPSSNAIVTPSEDVARKLVSMLPALADRILTVPVDVQSSGEDPQETVDLARDLEAVIETATSDGFVRPREELAPPPAMIGDGRIFPVRLPYRIAGVGRFPSQADYESFRDRVMRCEGLALNERLPARRRYLSAHQRRTANDFSVVMTVPQWTRNGVNVHTERVARGLSAMGIDVRVLLTEAATYPVSPAERMDLPTDVHVEQLNVAPDDGWGTRWGELQRIVEAHRPCIFIPTWDYRHATIIPRLPEGVYAIDIPSVGDDLHVEQIRRLSAHWSAVIVRSVSDAEALQSVVPDIVTRTMIIPDGLDIAGTPLRGPAGCILLAGRGDDFNADGIVRSLRSRGSRAPIAMVSSASNPEIRRNTDGLDWIDWPFRTSVTADPGIVVYLDQSVELPVEVKELIGRGYAPVLRSGAGDGFDGETCLRVGTPEEAAQAIRRLKTDTVLRDRLGAGAHQVVRRANVTIADMAESYAELMMEVIATGAQAAPGPLSPPPARVGAVSLFPVKLGYRDQTLGSFPSRRDRDEYLARVSQESREDSAPQPVNSAITVD